MSRPLYHQKAELEFELFDKQSSGNYSKLFIESLQEKLDRVNEQLKDSDLCKEAIESIYISHAADLRKEVTDGIYSDKLNCLMCKRYLSIDYKKREASGACDRVKAQFKLINKEPLTNWEKSLLQEGALHCGDKYAPAFDEETVAEIRKHQEEMRMLMINLWEQQALDNL